MVGEGGGGGVIQTKGPLGGLDLFSERTQWVQNFTIRPAIGIKINR